MKREDAPYISFALIEKIAPENTAQKDADELSLKETLHPW
jgi:hypothetical protein